MNTNVQPTDTLAELTEQAVDLAARAMAYGIARLIDAYVPLVLADRFAMRIAVVLLREVHARDEATLRSVASSERR
jgi:hypothetical protein